MALSPRPLPALLLLTALASGSVRSGEAARTSFLVMLCDDLGYGDLGCYGNRTIRTPNLDRLAAEGMRLTDCYAAAPVCSPSRAGLLTGRTPNRAGVYDWIPSGRAMHLRRSETTVARLLREAGYATCHAGKWHLNGRFNSTAQPQPEDHGFEHWFSTQNNAAPSHENPRNFVRNGDEVGTVEGYSCQVVADEAIHWLKTRRDRDKPFFLFVCFHEPHEPIASPPELVARYPGATKKGEALYYANVSNMDRAVGRLLGALDELGLAETTFVFFTSDNGPETLDRYRGAWRSHGSPGPLRGMKLHIYEGGIRVPGIIRWPGRTKPGQVVDRPVSGVDLLPTLCEIAGVKLPPDLEIDGTSVLAIFEGNPVARQTPLFWQYNRAISEPRVALRSGDWKVCARLEIAGEGRPGNLDNVRKVRLGALELYNLRSDPSETRDLAEEESDELAKLSSQLTAVFEDVRKESPLWDSPKTSSRRPTTGGMKGRKGSVHEGGVRVRLRTQGRPSREVKGPGRRACRFSGNRAGSPGR